jgi:thiosulfate dehydrogenase (quinone) large subunit
MMALMWFAEFPPDRTTSAGEPSMSTNPVTRLRRRTSR